MLVLIPSDNNGAMHKTTISKDSVACTLTVFELILKNTGPIWILPICNDRGIFGYHIVGSLDNTLYITVQCVVTFHKEDPQW